jgi:hypothetical protein
MQYDNVIGRLRKSARTEFCWERIRYEASACRFVPWIGNTVKCVKEVC